jgi:hypothetical protein
MKSDQKPTASLREIELKVLAEGREWTRRRLEQRLQQEADRELAVLMLDAWQAYFTRLGSRQWPSPLNGALQWLFVDQTKGLLSQAIDFQRSGRIGMPSKPMSLQTTGPVLDSGRLTKLMCPGRSAA